MKNKMHEKSDVWSFGVMLIELFSKGARPYNDIWPEEHGGPSAEQIITYLRTRKRLSRPAACPASIYDMITDMCWKYQPHDRQSFETIINKLHQIESELPCDELQEDEMSGSECDELDGDDDDVDALDAEDDFEESENEYNDDDGDADAEGNNSTTSCATTTEVDTVSNAQTGSSY